jgi:alkylation response protein AidB-like acyl-CoA dehydrogenase
MDFRLDETQEAITRLAAEVLDGATGEPDKSWAALGQAGLLSLAVPERLGGAGLGVLETVLVLTEIGRRAADVPALQHLALGVLPIARWGTERQQDELLTGRTLGAAVAEPGDPMPSAPRTTVASDGTVTGVKTGVRTADRLLVTVAGPAVVIVDPSGPGATLADGILHLDRVAADRLGGPESHAGLHRFAIAGACALGDGLLAGALGLTAEHVRTRHQFGRPLATFQAVAQQIADVYITSRTLHLVAVTAAWRLGTGRPADDDLDVATQWFTAEAPPAARTCHHLHGGLGLSVDYPLHRYTALIRDLTRFLGGGEYRLNVLADRVISDNRETDGGAACSSN